MKQYTLILLAFLSIFNGFQPYAVAKEHPTNEHEPKRTIGIRAYPTYPQLCLLSKRAQNCRGLMIVKIYQDSPAEKAGLQEGDLIQKVNGKTSKMDPVFELGLDRYLKGDR